MAFAGLGTLSYEYHCKLANYGTVSMHVQIFPYKVIWPKHIYSRAVHQAGGGGGGGGEGVYVPPTPHSEINVHNVFVRMSNKVLNLV